MPTTMRAATPDDAELVAVTRMRCYGGADKELPRFRLSTSTDLRVKSGDILLCERDGRCVGTATSLSFPLYVSGVAVPAQGVAWVGTIKSDRRKRSTGKRGVASHIMNATIALGRERGDVVSALMPFRASFYEHFGYGVVERRANWTIPISILPSASDGATRFAETSDLPALAAARSLEAQAGQCDIDTGLDGLKTWHTRWEDGMVVVDVDDHDVARGYLWMADETAGERRVASVQRWMAPTHDGFLRLLGFLAGLKDQYSAVKIALPIDWPIHHLLAESQVPHRAVDHPTATCQMHTRMQLRVLDHAKWCASMRVSRATRGETTVAIRECEGHTTRLRLHVEGGRIEATPSSATPAATMSDVTWACITSGELDAGIARGYGKLEADDDALAVLAAFRATRRPWCNDYF